jgi:predicted nucleotidyltransferase component of viral defense system
LSRYSSGAQAIADHLAIEALLTATLHGFTFEDTEKVMEDARKVLTRAATTEFEYKVGRHLQKPRKQKEHLLERITEYGNEVRADWKVTANSALVELIQSALE